MPFFQGSRVTAATVRSAAQSVADNVPEDGPEDGAACESGDAVVWDGADVNRPSLADLDFSQS